MIKKKNWFGSALFCMVFLLSYGCRSKPEPIIQPTQLFPAETRLLAQTGTQTPSTTPLPGTATISPTPVSASATQTPTPVDAYPFPVIQSEENFPGTQDLYPPPFEQPGEGTSGTPDEYPAPIQGDLPDPTQTSEPVSGTAQTPAALTPSSTAGPTATERVPQPFGLDETPATGKISIYHSLKGAKFDALMQIVWSFQEFYPDVTFDLTYIPQADLLERYTQAAYNGAGPDLLLGSSDWRASLDNQTLVEDLTPYISDSFREVFNPVALETGEYHGSQVCLPYDLRGVLLYRNRKILSEAPKTFDQLLSLVKRAAGVGTIGAYFEGGSYFSLGHLVGLGGRLLDPEANPRFEDDQYRAALAWLDLLKAMKQSGALEINGDRDLKLFKEGKSGLLVEGNWNREALAQAIGTKNLVIDPWPAHPNGRLSGFVQSDCIYLNANTEELSTLDHQAALTFIGYLLTAPMQERLAEAGIIPALRTAQPTDPLTRQAMLAFLGGTAYPAEFDDVTRQVYFTAFDGAVAAVLDQGQDPKTALKMAFEAIQDRMKEIHSGDQ